MREWLNLMYVVYLVLAFGASLGAAGGWFPAILFALAAAVTFLTSVATRRTR